MSEELKSDSGAGVEELLDAARELVKVANLRGDNELPHPCDDPGLWTARMQTAWDDLERVVNKYPHYAPSPQRDEWVKIEEVKDLILSGATRDDLVSFYYDLIAIATPGFNLAGDEVKAINAAIINRWSEAGLLYIKTQAWSVVESAPPLRSETTENEDEPNDSLESDT